ncbi:MAG: hypothetical protein QNL86_06950 [Crocinitomicaceae bacterium]
MVKPQIRIAKPCQEDWSKMSTNKIGKHCQLCDKTVVDFTKMSSDQIAAYLMRKSKESICGRILSTTPITQLSKKQQWFNRVYKKIELGVSFQPIRVSLLSTLSVLMLVMGCQQDIPRQKNTAPEVPVLELSDSIAPIPGTLNHKGSMKGAVKDSNVIKTLGLIRRPEFIIPLADKKHIIEQVSIEPTPIVGKVVLIEEIGEVVPLEIIQGELTAGQKNDSLK